MIVRPASRGDLIGIGRVAEAAHWESYTGLLQPDTIGRLLTRRFGPAALARRLLRGGIRVVDLGGDVIGFSDGVVDGEAVHVDAIAVEPQARRTGVGTALLVATAALAPGLPVTADVLLGNVEGEAFYEVNGFVPGEIVHGRMFGEDVVERRWWREPAAETQVEGRRAAGR